MEELSNFEVPGKCIRTKNIKESARSTVDCLNYVIKFQEHKALDLVVDVVACGRLFTTKILNVK